MRGPWHFRRTAPVAISATAVLKKFMQPVPATEISIDIFKPEVGLKLDVQFQARAKVINLQERALSTGNGAPQSGLRWPRAGRATARSG